jgi:hypothetical protein
MIGEADVEVRRGPIDDLRDTLHGGLVHLRGFPRNLLGGLTVRPRIGGAVV